VLKPHEFVIRCGRAWTGRSTLQPARRPALHSFCYEITRSWCQCSVSKVREISPEVRAIAWTQFGAPNALHTAPTGRGIQVTRFPRAALRFSSTPTRKDRVPGARGYFHAVPGERPSLAGRPIESARSNGRFRTCDCPGPEVQLQILRLTTPKLKNVWGPFRSG